MSWKTVKFIDTGEEIALFDNKAGFCKSQKCKCPIYWASIPSYNEANGIESDLIVSARPDGTYTSHWHDCKEPEMFKK